jgi:hypothetical protein
MVKEWSRTECNNNDDKRVPSTVNITSKNPAEVRYYLLGVYTILREGS